VASIIQSIDKLDKLSEEQVADELVSKGLSVKQAEQAIIAIKQAEPTQELQKIIELAQALGVPESSLKFTPTIARGLDYYTGMIFEIVVPEFTGGSLGGGGRYDNLIKDLSGLDMPAVGVGIGFDRTVEAAVQLGLAPVSGATAQILVTVFDDTFRQESAQITQQLRQAGVSAELYTQSAKLGKQFKYAGRRGIPYVIVIGEEESAKQQINLKDMQTGEQQTLTIDDAIRQIKLS